VRDFQCAGGGAVVNLRDQHVGTKIIVAGPAAPFPRYILERKRRCVRNGPDAEQRADRYSGKYFARHSIISAARCCTANGTERPSALAVFRLIAISYFVGVCTRRSLGFSPLRMRST